MRSTALRFSHRPIEAADDRRQEVIERAPVAEMLQMPSFPNCESSFLRNACTCCDLRDLLGEVHLTVIVGRITDHAPGVCDRPEIMRVAANPIEDLERHAVLVL